MPKIDIASVPKVFDSSYPEPWGSAMGRRSFQDVGDAAGLTQYGVVLAVLEPGATSSLRHWHSHEDEFVWVLEGELVLVQDAGEVMLRAGEAAGFRAGDPDGHQLLNRSEAPARYLVVGSRVPGDVCTYSDVDLVFRDGQFTRRDGSPVEGTGMSNERQAPEAFVREAIGAFYAGADLAEWAGHGLFPFHVLTPRLQMTIPDEAALVERLRLLRSGLGRLGVARVEAEVRSVLRPNPDDAMVAVTNNRIGQAGERLGRHMAMYVLRWIDGRWRFQAISMHDADQDTAIREKLERMFGGADGQGS